MSDSQKVKIKNLHKSRLKSETDKSCQEQKTVDAVSNGDRLVRVETLVKAAVEAMTKTYTKNEQLLTLASKTVNEEAVKADLEKCLHRVSIKTDEVLRKAREYINSCSKTDLESHSSDDTTYKMSSKVFSTAIKSRSFSQRQKKRLLATHGREEIERANDISLRLAKQKQDLERKKLGQEKERSDQEQAMKLLELEEENRQKRRVIFAKHCLNLVKTVDEQFPKVSLNG